VIEIVASAPISTVQAARIARRRGGVLLLKERRGEALAPGMNR
jgi:hypothetical protein